MRILGGVLVALFALGFAFASVLKHPTYTPDGIVYARFAARDAGYSERDATLMARAFYDHTSMMSNPRYRALVELDPSASFARSKVFENRVLYPWVVGMALPSAGFRALFLVNAAAYVAFGLAVFWMLLAFRRPEIALVLSLIAIALPLTRQIAASDLTDTLAMVWWALSLGALLRLARGTTPQMLAVLAVSSALLVLTRPTPYLVVFPALALGIVRGLWLPLVASLGGVIAYVAVAAMTHAYGISEQLRWEYDHRHFAMNMTIQGWYRVSLGESIRYVIAETFRTVVPLAMIAAAIYGVLRRSTRAEMWVLVAAAIACLIAVPFNPVLSSFARVIMLPLIPVFCGITQCTVEALLDRTMAKAPVEHPAPRAAV